MQVLVELIDEELFTVQLDLVMKLKAILFSMVDDLARSLLFVAVSLPLTNCLPFVWWLTVSGEFDEDEQLEVDEIGLRGGNLGGGE